MPTSPLVGLYNCGYYKRQFLEEVAQEFREKAFVVQSGLESFSKAETLAFMVLESQGFFES